MITVTIFRQHDELTAIEISGHANSGPYDHDLVCAAVSAVSFGTINAILKLCDQKLHIDQAENDGGYLFVKIPSIDVKDQKDNVQLLLEAMLVSLQTIERDYGDFIKIKQQQ